MNLLTIDTNTCTKCGICTTVCTAGLIEKDGNGFPKEIADADELCNRCGACVACCPTASLDHRDLPLALSLRIDADSKPSFEQLALTVKSRRSARIYHDKPVPREVLTAIIDAARYSPTGGNLQTVQWLIVDDPATMQKLREIGRDYVIETFKSIPVYASRVPRFEKRRDEGNDIFLHGAPAIVCTLGPAGSGIAPMDCSIALSYFDLLANSAGLGCCWIGMFSAAANNHPEISRLIKLPEGMQVYASMIVGYPKYTYPRIPVRNEAVINWL